jgi:hypothetical protein
MRTAAYVILGLLTLAGAVMADTRGWLATRPATLQNVPRSIRQNPGAYRSLYNGSPRFFGGK